MNIRVRRSIAACLLALLVSTALFAPARGEPATSPSSFEHEFAFAAQQLALTAADNAATSYPITTKATGSWNTTSATNWTSGFFPGSLWLMYQRDGDTAWRTKAQAWQAGIEGQKTRTDTHDLGFMIFNSFGNGYRLTGDDAYRQVVLRAAASLATRYNPTVGSLKSWNGPSTDFKVIIDNMLNLELLFWAAKHGGDPAWYDMAVSHALKTRENHVRADGSTYHLVNYNPSTGAVQQRVTAQGYSDESTWARGQAWAVYGFTMAYRETSDARFLETARTTAEYFIAHLPSDQVPYWDFQAPGIPNEPRDSSASAVAASGLLELSRLEPDSARAQRYHAAATNMLVALSSAPYLAEGTSSQAILLHGTRHKPAGDYDTGTVWGDYYFLEALLRYQETASGSLAGTVTDAETGAAIQGATVGYGSGSATTDAGGRFSIAQLDLGAQTIVVEAQGYDPAEHTVTIPPGGAISITVALTPQRALVRGSVGDKASGEPISGAVVRYDGGTATSDALGQYALPGVRPGSYRFEVSAEGYITATQDVTVTLELPAPLDFALERRQEQPNTIDIWLPLLAGG